MARQRHYLEYHDSESNSHKFWEIVEQPGGSFIASWGRVGTAGQTMVYDHETAMKKLHEKEKKGYEEC